MHTAFQEINLHRRAPEGACRFFFKESFQCLPNRQKKTTDDPFLEVQTVTKTFGRFVALENVSIEGLSRRTGLHPGPSGCGKTTLLRIIAGLEEQNVGQVFLKGKDISRIPTSSASAASYSSPMRCSQI